jgi:hypothetical protein
MNRTSFIAIFFLLLATKVVEGGFRDPGVSTSDRSVEIQVERKSTAAPAGTAPRNTASVVNSTYGPLPAPASAPFTNQNTSSANPAGKKIIDGQNMTGSNVPKWNSPVPKSPGLPGKENIQVGDVFVPGYEKTVTIFRDNLAPIQVKQNTGAELHQFSRKARQQPLPNRDYSDKPRSPDIVSRYDFALHPQPHKVIRTPIQLQLRAIAKIFNPPSPTQYENMVKRLDALFDGIYFEYHKGIAALWGLSVLESNPKQLQARDALFAGILSKRNGWETAASNLYFNSVNKGIEKEDRYLQILWSQLEDFSSINQIDRIVEKVNPVRAQHLLPEGDKANYAMAKRILAGKANPALKAEIFRDKIQNSVLQQKLDLMRSIASLRNKDAPQEAAFQTLVNLEQTQDPGIQQESRLALARVQMKKGNSKEALSLYQNVTKTRENRLEVLAEQSYAELKNGLYHDSLGKAVGLQSPYFKYGFAPDIHLVEVLSRKAICDFGGAEASVEKFFAAYNKEAAAIQSLLAKAPVTKEFYEELISYHGKAEPNRFERYMLRLPEVMENQKTMNQAQREFEKIGQVGTKSYSAPRPANWEKFEQAMKSDWKVRANQLRGESAKDALVEAEYLLKRLKSTMAQLELLDLDISTAAARNYNMQSALNFPVRELAQLKIEEDRFHWPFENEVWEDELDFLKMKNPSKCASAYLPESTTPVEN